MIDQTALLFLAVAAVGLIRERQILPFLIVVFGALVTGLLPATLLAALILWHRIDRRLPGWVQLKDAVGFFFILIGSIAPDVVREFCLVTGILFMSMSFGAGALGVIPPLLLLRQVVPEPPIQEVILGSAGLYWVVLEITKWTKTRHERVIMAVIETLCSLAILIGLRELAAHWIEDTTLVTIGSGVAFIAIVLGSWRLWKGASYGAFFRGLRKSISRSLLFASRTLSDAEPWPNEPATPARFEIESSFNRFFILIVATLAVLVIFILAGRGGLL